MPPKRTAAARDASPAAKPTTRKRAKVAEAPATTAAEAEAPAKQTARRGRGRPRGSAVAQGRVSAPKTAEAEATPAKQTARRGRGRPRGSAVAQGRISSAKTTEVEETPTKQTARRGRGRPRGSAVARGRIPSTKTADAEAEAPRKYATKQTARRGFDGRAPPGRGASKAKAAASPPTAPRRLKQTARRSGGFVGQGRIQLFDLYDKHAGRHDDEDEEDEDSENDDEEEEDDGDDDSEGGKPANGKLNVTGDYDVECEGISSEWPSMGDDFSLTLTTENGKLWGEFDFGVISGIMRFGKIPKTSKNPKVSFKWRGDETDGMMLFGDDYTGSVQFYGNGRIKGDIMYLGSYDFKGKKVKGQKTTSPNGGYSMLDRYEQYNEEEYDRANRARWH